jgi:predicted metal-binding membrane protein
VIWPTAEGTVGRLGHVRAALARVAWQHPQWWLFILSAFAWVAILAESSGLPISVCRSAGRDVASRLGSFDLVEVLAGAWLPEMLGWSWMLLATMLPLAAWPVRHAALRSLWKRRHRAGLGVVLGYLAVWTIAGAGLSVLVVGFGSKAEPQDMRFAGLALLLAALWQWSPVKREALRACHRTAALAVDGWQADLGCARYGWNQGRNCLVSCWALMFAMVLASHQVVVMLTIFLICVIERARHRPLYRQTSVVLVVLAAAVTLL